MFQYYNAITNTKGDVLSGYYVAAVDPVAGTNVAIYSDVSSTPISVVSGLANKARVDTDGNVAFFITEGTYHLDIYGPDGTTKVKRISNVLLQSGAPGAKGDPGDGIATLSAMANVSPSDGDVSILSEPNRQGLFYYRAGNYTAEVAADTSQYYYVPLAIDPTGAAGAWIRANLVPLAVLGNYANDAAAAAGGVPVGRAYRNGSALMIRVA